MAQGRGAWTTIGKDNGSVYYEYIKDKPADGSAPEKGRSYLAVNYGVRAIQVSINAHAFALAALSPDGNFGPKTSAAVRAAQSRLEIPIDGQVGAKTMRALLLPLVRRVQDNNKIPGDYLCGLIRWESDWDPGAVGYVVDNDHGIVQINEQYNPTISIAQAFDPDFAIAWAGKRLAASFVKYESWEPAIASYNSPKYAAEWVTTGKAPNTAIYKYVTNIMRGNAG